MKNSLKTLIMGLTATTVMGSVSLCQCICLHKQAREASLMGCNIVQDMVASILLWMLAILMYKMVKLLSNF